MLNIYSFPGQAEAPLSPRIPAPALMGSDWLCPPAFGRRCRPAISTPHIPQKSVAEFAAGDSCQANIAPSFKMIGQDGAESKCIYTDIDLPPMCLISASPYCPQFPLRALPQANMGKLITIGSGIFLAIGGDFFHIPGLYVTRLISILCFQASSLAMTAVLSRPPLASQRLSVTLARRTLLRKEALSPPLLEALSSAP